MMRALRAGVAWLAGLISVSACGHDLITAEVTEQYLATVTQNAAILQSAAPPARRSEAAFVLGRTLDEIREFLNRDIAAHGQVQGLASNRLVLELKARGAPLQVLTNGRFAANLSYYREALSLAPHGARESDALFRILQGYFYDSFDDDPMAPRQQSWTQLRQQIDYGERLVTRMPPHPELEEVRFILLIHYVQAARAAPGRAASRDYAAKARMALTEFERAHPDSLRAAAVPMLRERLEAN